MIRHPGLHKFFRNLSLATKRVEEHRNSRDKLSGYLQKIRIVASRSPKKSVIHSEIAQLEKHISEMLSKKTELTKKKPKDFDDQVKKLKHKEEELDNKISQLNMLLVKVGKKVNEKQLKQELGKRDSVDQLEEKLYSLESKYQQYADNQEIPASLLDSIQEKISLLKEKIRELKNK